jgi:hypothetical protein
MADSTEGGGMWQGAVIMLAIALGAPHLPVSAPIITSAMPENAGSNVQSVDALQTTSGYIDLKQTCSKTLQKVEMAPICAQIESTKWTAIGAIIGALALIASSFAALAAGFSALEQRKANQLAKTTFDIETKAEIAFEVQHAPPRAGDFVDFTRFRATIQNTGRQSVIQVTFHVTVVGGDMEKAITGITADWLKQAPLVPRHYSIAKGAHIQLEAGAPVDVTQKNYLFVAVVCFGEELRARHHVVSQSYFTHPEAGGINAARLVYSDHQVTT